MPSAAQYLLAALLRIWRVDLSRLALVFLLAECKNRRGNNRALVYAGFVKLVRWFSSRASSAPFGVSEISSESVNFGEQSGGFSRRVLEMEVY